MADKEKLVEKQIIEAKIVEIPTQVEELVELPDGSRVKLLQFFVEIYNDIQKIKKAVA